MQSKHQFIQKSIVFSRYGRQDTFHCVPDFKSKVSLRNSIYCSHDRAVVEKVIGTGAFVVSSKDYERFGETNQSELAAWQIKILAQLFLYYKPEIKILAYESEIERLSNLIAIMQTSNFAQIENFNVCIVGENQPRGPTMKATVKLRRSKLFEI